MTKRNVSGAAVERAGIAIAAAIAGGVGIQTALAQDAGGVTVEVSECVSLQAPEERFACYERHVDAAVQQSPAAALPSEPGGRVEPAAPPGAPGAAPAAAAASATPPRGESTEPEEIVATVTALRQTVPNSHVITLDNGQIWRQTYAEWYPLQPGQRVRLRPSKWGGVFRLTADELNGYIQVQRVR